MLVRMTFWIVITGFQDDLEIQLGKLTEDLTAITKY